jgi:negative regulator of sigma E activity
MCRGLAGLAVAACVLLAACAGPVPDYGAYRHAALNTATAMVGVLAAAQLAVQVDLRGRAFPAFTDDNVTSAEGDGNSISSTFGSRQPPDHRSEVLGQKVTQALSSATTALTDLRVAVREGNPAQTQHAMAEVRKALRLFQGLQRALR